LTSLSSDGLLSDLSTVELIFDVEVSFGSTDIDGSVS